MQNIRRFIYLLYYLKESDYSTLSSFLRYASSGSGKSRMRIMSDAVVSVFKYNVSLKDYFSFRFFELGDIERKKWAGTGFMYEYQLIMNPEGPREVLENKILFLQHFKSFVKRKYFTYNELKDQKHLAEMMLSNTSGKLVLKGSRGQVGAEVKVIDCAGFTSDALTGYMKDNKLDLAEEYVIQHKSLMDLSASGLNTVRVFTQLHSGKVDILGARLRVSVNSPVDNMAAGNLAAPIDPKTGVVNGPGVYSDITKEDRKIHPVTGRPITGFIIPYWKEVVELSENAALLTPENKSVGWDIAITDNGPELIEGNHNWCKLLWQLPVKKGMKQELEKYM